MKNRKKISLANRVLALAEKGRAIYQRKDALFEELVQGVQVGEVLETRQGRFEVVDNFATRHVGFRPASFHRFELKEVKTPRPEKPVPPVVAAEAPPAGA